MNDSISDSLAEPAFTPPAPVMGLSYDGPKAPLFKALHEARKHFKSLTADSKADVQLKGGGGYKHSYADLDTVIQALTPGWDVAGLAVCQPFDGHSVHTVVAIGDSSLTISTPVPYWETPQQLGSGLTYIRRYQLKGLFCVNDSEDDDANAAQGNKATITRKEPSAPAPRSNATSLSKDTSDEVIATAKAKGLDGAGLNKVVFEQTGQKWKDCSELDAKKVLAALVLL